MTNNWTLETILRRAIPSIANRANSGGWFPVLCQVCNDHGQKGPRAAFLFTDGGDGMSYHCFNCEFKTSYSPHKDRSFSNNFKKLARHFHIPLNDCNDVLLRYLGSEEEQQAEEQKLIDYEPKTITMPPRFYQMTEDPDDLVANCAIDYLRDERMIDWTQHKWFLAEPNGKDKDQWFGRLIIPVYKDNRLIYYAGRDLTDSMPRKYKNCEQARDNVLYGFDRLMENTDAPLYVMEGIFDAMLVKGVAMFGRTMTEGQIYWLNRSRRPKVVIPDKFGDGHELAEQALSLGWSVTTPDIGDEKDVTDAVKKYGMLYTLKTLKDNISSGLAATINIGTYCK